MGFPEGHPITVAEFLKAVGDLKMRGTSQLFRATVSIQQYVKEVRDRYVRTLEKSRAVSPVSSALRTQMQVEAMARSPKSAGGKSPMYDLAVHTVKIKKSGSTMNFEKMVNIDVGVSLSSTRQPTINTMLHKASLDFFSQDSVSNEVVKGLRYLQNLNKKVFYKNNKLIMNWGNLDSITFGKNIIRVCEAVRDIMKCESRLLELGSPVYIMGDLHGNFPDLLYLEKLLWHIGPGLCPCKLLFLGDYVDRGPQSIEIIAYLFSYKMQSPHKVNLIRGNHEIREVQKMFTFYSECQIKFGDKLGEEVWNSVNNAFDMMPLAATVDGRVFCCHGGIPPPWLCPVVSAINDIPIQLSQPDEQSSLAWELMWNDPVRPKFLTEKTTMELLANEGFAANARRGTAHVFSSEALERFLKVNSFSHMVRAHEVAQAGFQVQQKGKLLTVFSSSKYCGGDNEAACVLADQLKLRILRFETE